MLDFNMAIILFLIFLMLNIIGMIFVSVRGGGFIISILFGTCGLLFVSYLISDPNVFYTVYQSPIYLSNGTELSAGQWVTYSQQFIWYPWSMIVLALFSVMCMAVGGIKSLGE